MYLDVIPPTVSFGNRIGHILFTRSYRSRRKTHKEFYIPITIRHGSCGQFRTNVIHGSFIWINGLNSSSYPFQYAVTAETDIDTASLVWQTAIRVKSWNLTKSNRATASTYGFWKVSLRSEGYDFIYHGKRLRRQQENGRLSPIIPNVRLRLPWNPLTRPDR